MYEHPESLLEHRIRSRDLDSLVQGSVRFAPTKSLWFNGMAIAALIGGLSTFTWASFFVFLASTGTVLLLGHSLGSHRKLIHDSFQCPKWLEYTLVYLGVQVGLAGPLGLLRQHDLRDYAQRLPDCHLYLRHGRSFLVDGWWQLNCDLKLANPPSLHFEARIAGDRFYRFLERTWMMQQLPVAAALYVLGGWSWVFWGVCARVFVSTAGHWSVTYFCHNPDLSPRPGRWLVKDAVRLMRDLHGVLVEAVDGLEDLKAAGAQGRFLRRYEEATAAAATAAPRRRIDQALRVALKEKFLPAFALMTGDQIYADATAGLTDPISAVERYFERYATAFGTHDIKPS